MSEQVYMTAKLNLADGTILYPQVSLDNIVASISDPTLVSVATTTNGKVPVTELPVVTVVGDTGSNNNIPTEAAVRALADTKQNTLVAGTGTEIINGSTINAMAVNLNDVVVNNVPSNGLYLEVEGNTMSVVGALAANDSAGVIAGAANGVTLDQGIVKANPGDGLLVEANKVAIDDASVETTLQDVRIDGASTVSPVEDQVVTPGNLRGALSLGQAVDVSCPPKNRVGWAQGSADGGTTWENLDYSFSLFDNIYLDEFQTRVTYTGECSLGWQDFPKYATGLKYLYMCDAKLISGTGKMQFASYTDSGWVRGKLVALSQDEWNRVYVVSNADYATAVLTGGTSGVDTIVAYRNWRQYEVTVLTDEAIAYIAQLPDPDVFFRTASVYSLRDKYLVKQDMVCPFIPTISMPDNSDLTVAAGLSYKIKYTNDNPHIITADTIPVDGYGWDSHIQMFIKGTSSIVFQQPLILMDALTPNAGHNLSIKWRNGDALVYVDDTNAGNIVLYATGSTAGTLNYLLQQNPGSGQDNYIIFAAATDGLTCDAGTVSIAYSTDILGNGTDNTAITGAFSVAGGKTMNLQDLAVTGSTLSGTGAIDLSNVAVDGMVSCASSTLDGIKVPAGKTLVLSEIYPAVLDCDLEGTLVWNKSTASSNKYWFKRLASASGGVLTATESTTYIRPVTDSDVLISGITIAGGTNGLRISPTSGSGHSLTVENCYIYGNDSAWMYGGDGWSVIIRNSVIKDNTADGLNQAAGYIKDGLLHVEDTTIENNSFQLDGTASAYVKGTFTIKGDCYGFHVEANKGHVTVLPDTMIDMSRQTRTEGLTNGYWRITLGDNITLKTADGRTAVIDAADMVNFVYSDAELTALSGSIAISGSTANPWRATNIIFGSPLDASAASTVTLSGATFTDAARTLNANRIQLPAATTVSFSGNTNAADTKILQAPVIVVGNNAAAPSGSATVVNAAGTASTVSGIGTYIDKEGDNDFVALSNVSTVSTSATSGAGSLPVALTGSNKFVRIADNTVGTVGAATDVVDKTIMTNEYEPIIGGTFSLTSATVNETTKTVAIQSGGTMSIVDIRGGKDSVIDLGRTNIAFPQDSATHRLSGVAITGGSGSDGGAFYARNASMFASDVTISGNNATEDGGGVAINLGGYMELTDCIISGNIANGSAYDARVAYGGVLKMYGGTLGSAKLGDNANIKLYDTVKVERISDKHAVALGSVTLTSGAIVDLTGNTNTTPIAPGGGITFEQGGATVYPSAGSAAAYMLGGMTVPQIGNTNVIPLIASSGGSAIVSSGASAFASGCTFDGTGLNIGTFEVQSGGTLTLSDCTVIGGRYRAVQANSNCTVNLTGGANLLDRIYIFENGVNVTFGGVNTCAGVYNAGSSGTVTISSGASINLASSIAPGGTGGITVLTGGCTVNGNVIPAGTYTSIDSNGQPT